MTPDPETTTLAARLRTTLRELVYLSRSLGQDLALTPAQGGVLTALLDGPRRVGDLAARQGVRVPTVLQQLARLEDEGYVERGGDPADGRVSLVHLTEAGRRVLDTVDAARDALLAERLTDLDADQQAAIAAALPALRTLTARHGTHPRTGTTA